MVSQKVPIVILDGVWVVLNHFWLWDASPQLPEHSDQHGGQESKHNITTWLRDMGWMILKIPSPGVAWRLRNIQILQNHHKTHQRTYQNPFLMPFGTPNMCFPGMRFHDFSKWMLLDISAVDGRGTKKNKICVELGYSDPRFSGIYPTPSELGDIESQTFSISI